MAKKNNNTLLIVAAIGVGGYFLWKHSQNAVAATVPVASNATPPLVVSSQQVVTPAVVSQPTTDPRIVEINKWVSTLSVGEGSAVTKALAVMSSSEIDGLYDVVYNDFYGNGITTPSQAQFWNTWRAKYSIPAS